MHKLKLAEIDNPDLVFQAANGTQAGEYELFTMDGTMNVQLIVAHETSLAVAYQEAVVVVADGGTPEL